MRNSVKRFTWEASSGRSLPGGSDSVRRNQFRSDYVVGSLNQDALTEIKRDFPELTTGFIIFLAIGYLPGMQQDFLSFSAARATPRPVRDVHRHNRAVHVWTVNDAGITLSMIEMGVGNIITDEPALLRSLLEEWNRLSGGEKIALMFRNLVVGFERPEPSNLCVK